MHLVVMIVQTVRLECTRCGGAWKSPAEFSSDLLLHVRALYHSHRSMQAFKDLREATGLDLGDAKAILHHLADADCTCQRCHAPLNGDAIATCWYCKALNYDPCGAGPSKHGPGSDRDGRSAIDRVHEIFGDYGAAARRDEWRGATASLAEGARIKGKAVLVYHFGVYVDLGVGFPALLEVIEFDHRSRRREEKPPWPRVGEVIEGRIVYVNSEAHVIRLSQQSVDPKPRLAKAHSKLVTDEYLRLGWTLRREFFAEGVDEPYEYLLEWNRDEEPVSIDWDAFRAKHRANR